jgi:ribosomal protein S18 acetylase RimI-like enzyme
VTTPRLRAARLEDAAAIARVHVQAWRETYRGLVPDAVLASLSVEQRVRAWSDMLAAGPRAPAIFVAEEESEIIGFAAAGPSRDQLLKCDGEVSSIYLLDGYKRRGIGRALFTQAVSSLCERGCTSAGLWVLDTNVGARRFYESMGGRAGPTKVDARPDVTLHEVAYVWDHIEQKSGRFRLAGSP